MKPDGALARLLAQIGITQAEAPVAEAPVADEALAALQTQFDAFRSAAEADQAELKTALTAALAAVQEGETQREELAAQLAALQAANAQAAADAEMAKANARKQKIVAVVGTARADALFDATANLADEAFEAVIGAMNTASAKEAASPMFTETGASAEASAEVANTPSKEMQILKQKYADQATA